MSNKNYVYVLSVVWQRDSGECGGDVMAFETIEKAHERMVLEMKSARIDFNDLDTIETQYVEGDMSWSIWERESYCYNHCDIAIKECEVE